MNQHLIESKNELIELYNNVEKAWQLCLKTQYEATVENDEELAKTAQGMKQALELVMDEKRINQLTTIMNHPMKTLGAPMVLNLYRECLDAFSENNLRFPVLYWTESGMKFFIRDYGQILPKHTYGLVVMAHEALRIHEDKIFNRNERGEL